MALRLGRSVKRLAIADDGSGICEVEPPSSYQHTAANSHRCLRENLLVSLSADPVECAPEPVRNGWWL
jgi:hypothetical protein